MSAVDDHDRERAVVGEALDVSQLDIADGSLIVVKVETRLIAELLGEARTEALVQQLVVETVRLRDSLLEQGKRTSWMLTHPSVDLAALDEDEMRALGWVRAT